MFASKDNLSLLTSKAIPVPKKVHLFYFFLQSYSEIMPSLERHLKANGVSEYAIQPEIAEDSESSEDASVSGADNCLLKCHKECDTTRCCN